MKKNIKVSSNPVEVPVSHKEIESINDYGSVKISEKVIMAVIKRAAYKVPGVTRLGSGTLVDSITTMINSTKIPENIVKIEITGNEVEVYIKINVAYGHNIPEVAMKVQSTVTDEVKFITSMEVKKVDVEVQEVESPAVE